MVCLVRSGMDNPEIVPHTAQGRHRNRLVAQIHPSEMGNPVGIAGSDTPQIGKGTGHQRATIGATAAGRIKIGAENLDTEAPFVRNTDATDIVTES